MSHLKHSGGNKSLKRGGGGEREGKKDGYLALGEEERHFYHRSQSDVEILHQLGWKQAPESVWETVFLLMWWVFRRCHRVRERETSYLLNRRLRRAAWSTVCSSPGFQTATIIWNKEERSQLELYYNFNWNLWKTDSVMYFLLYISTVYME